MKTNGGPLVDTRKVRTDRKHVRYLDRGDRKRPLPSTPKDYEMRVNLIRVFELLTMNIPVAQIATLMGKGEPVIRSWIKKLTGDFSCLVQTQEARNRINENIAGWNLMISKAMSILTTTKEGDARRISAVQTIADLYKKKADYEVLVGEVKEAPKDLQIKALVGIHSNQHRAVDMDQIRDEVEDEDLDALFLTVAKTIERRQKKASARVVPNGTPPVLELEAAT